MAKRVITLINLPLTLNFMFRMSDLCLVSVWFNKVIFYSILNLIRVKYITPPLCNQKFYTNIVFQNHKLPTKEVGTAILEPRIFEFQSGKKLFHLCISLKFSGLCVSSRIAFFMLHTDSTRPSLWQPVSSTMIRCELERVLKLGGVVCTAPIHNVT